MATPLNTLKIMDAGCETLAIYRSILRYRKYKKRASTSPYIQYRKAAKSEKRVLVGGNALFPA